MNAGRYRAAAMLLALSLPGCSLLAPPPPPPAYVPLAYEGQIWCYRTLGTPECYAEEQPAYASRFIGAYVQRPPSPAPPDLSLQPLPAQPIPSQPLPSPTS